MSRIHWVHCGPDAVFGLRHLQQRGIEPMVWTAHGVSPDEIPAGQQRPYEAAALKAELARGDIIVAPRPTDLEVARIAMDCGAHLAVGWHVSPTLREAVGAAAGRGLSVLAEVGMVPGIDHLMARDLVNDYRQVAQDGDRLHFSSYGGGMPKHPDNFRHKFNLSPLPLLNALATPTSWIGQGETRRAAFPFEVIRSFDLNLPTPERHEVYPHYDVAPYLEAYGFDPGWTIATAERGAIRLKGWKQGWAAVFASIRQTGKDAEALATLSETLWAEHPFAPEEADRIVLSVALRAERDGRARWHREWVLDSTGGRSGFARFRLKSLMLALAAEALLAGRVEPGLHIGPTDPELIANWLVEITHEAGFARRIDHLRSDDAKGAA
ncbi:saccharopine dehydrogenase (NADP+, L-glutamate forming) [Paracoccus isoporae]|uniref:Saccharopine dehydrogenase (NADP+, L-glutamate forming) n=2 Tax=Paracoccus isoporae TaxID=591205 RepID=A0A1G6UTT5_9RHOB|nr:saccharopine dehydrogenase (NADP+, L-glutamate forming) [Paracoccus isoporae]